MNVQKITHWNWNIEQFNNMLLLFLPTSMSNPEQSAHILQEVGSKIQSYPFNYQDATILSGQEEGAYGWVTVNYLLENFIKVPKLVQSIGRFESLGIRISI